MTPTVLAAYVVMILLWGSTWAAIAIGVASVPPFVFAFERAVAVGVVLTLLSLALRLPFPRDGRTIAAAAAAGLFNIGVPWAVIFWSEQFVASGLVAVLGATFPIWTAILAHYLVRGDRLSALKIGALGLGLVGTAVLAGAPIEGGGPNASVAAALLSLLPILWALGAILAARYLSEAAPVPVVAIEIWASVVFLAPFALSQASAPSVWTPAVIGAFLFLVLGGSCIGLVLNLWLYRKLRPTTVALSQVLFAVQAVVLGAIMLGEEFTGRMIVGALLVFAAVGLNARAGSGAPRARDDAGAPAAAD